MILYLFDFDGTIFNTEKLKELLPSFVKDNLSIDANQFSDTYESSKNEDGAYDFYTHTRQIGSKLSNEEIKIKFETYFSNYDFLFPDFITFSNNIDVNNDLVVIFTLGFDTFQELKINLIPNLNGIRKIVLNTNKKRFLNENISLNNNGIEFKPLKQTFSKIKFVDDNPANLTKEDYPNLFQYRILRSGSKYEKIQTPTYAKEINLLTELDED